MLYKSLLAELFDLHSHYEIIYHSFALIRRNYYSFQFHVYDRNPDFQMIFQNPNDTPR